MSGSASKSEAGTDLGAWFWGGFVALILAGLLFTLFAAIRGGAQWVESRLEVSDLPPVWTQVVRVTLSGGESVDIDRDALAAVRAELGARIRARVKQAEERLSIRLETGLDTAFDGAAAAIPAFADWYYSLGGEYTRLFYAAMGELPEYLAGKMDELVFAPAGTAEKIDALRAELDLARDRELQSTAAELDVLLRNLVRSRSLDRAEGKLLVVGRWELNRQLGDHLGPYLKLGLQDMARQGLATTTGTAAAVVTAKKLGGLAVAKASGKVGAKVSAGTLAALASKLGLKSAAKAGSTAGGIGSGAAAGAALCAGTGVGAAVAPGCALIGGAATGLAVWLLVDSAVLEAEEYFHREELEAELHLALANQRQELEQGLAASHVSGVSSAFSGLLETLEDPGAARRGGPRKDFVPARAAGERLAP